MFARALIGSLVMAALLGLYLWAALFQGIVLIGTGEPVAVAMGVALIVLPVVGAWALYRELRFGFSSQKLLKIIQAEGDVPGADLDHRPSGRPIREQADEEFPRYAKAVDENPESWKAWFRLGIAYDGSGDRKRARAAIRTAIALHRKNPA